MRERHARCWIAQGVGMDPNLTIASAELDALRASVLAHDVRCEVYPERVAYAGGLEQVGFTVELYGSHDHPRHTPEPGCDECLRVHRDLVHIARAVVPREERPSVVEIEPYEPVLVADPRRGGRPRVRLTMRLLHRAAVRGAVDACERRCLAEILTALRSLGVAGAAG